SRRLDLDRVAQPPSAVGVGSARIPDPPSFVPVACPERSRMGDRCPGFPVFDLSRALAMHFVYFPANISHLASPAPHIHPHSSPLIPGDCPPCPRGSSLCEVHPCVETVGVSSWRLLFK